MIADAITYRAVRTESGVVAVVFTDGSNAPPERLRHIVRHSPTGLEFGYGGSGPADLALSILVDWHHRQGLPDQDACHRADSDYQDFKWHFLAAVQGPTLKIAGGQIAAWLAARSDLD